MAALSYVLRCVGIACLVVAVFIAPDRSARGDYVICEYSCAASTTTWSDYEQCTETCCLNSCNSITDAAQKAKCIANCAADPVSCSAGNVTCKGTPEAQCPGVGACNGDPANCKCAWRPAPNSKDPTGYDCVCNNYSGK